MAGDILIIDSVATNRIVLKVKLLATQYRARPCVSLDEARDEIAASLPDLILLDTCTDAAAVLALCNRLKEEPETGMIPIIAAGSFPKPRDRITALEAGADDVLTKPYYENIL
jgi:two-component system cell cycle response regulator